MLDKCLAMLYISLSDKQHTNTKDNIMKTIICKYNQNTMNYAKHPFGEQNLGEVKDLAEFHSKVKSWEYSRIIENEDGTIEDSTNGMEVYNPSYPTEFDFGDYSYILR
jgi:hypothetical protein